MKKWLVKNRLPLYLLSISALSGLFSIIVSYFPLSQAGPTSLFYFSSIKENARLATFILLAVSIVFWWTIKNNYLSRFVEWYGELSPGKKNIIVLVSSFSFTLALFFRNIFHGYFNYDDFELFRSAHNASLWKLLFVPYGDHPIPFFQMEILLFKSIFGVWVLPYNVFVWAVISLAPFFVFLVLRHLGAPERMYWIFFVLYLGSVLWGEILTGYFSISVYVQSILFYAVSSWAYLRWQISEKILYAIIWILFLFATVFIDIAGIWSIPAMFLFVLAISRAKNTVVPHKALALLVAATLAIAAYLWFIYVYLKTGVFVATSYSLDKFLSDLYSFFSVGIASSFLTPNASLFFLQPSFYNYFINIWPWALLVISLINAGILIYGYKNSEKKWRVLWVYLAVAVVICAALTILARPTSTEVAIFPFKHTVMAYFWYCLLLAFSISVWLSKNNHRGDIANWRKEAVVVFLVLFLSIQQIFGFFNTALANQAIERRGAVAKLSLAIGDTLPLARENLVIPNLDGRYINPLLAGFSLVQYLDFIPWSNNIRLIRNDAMAPTTYTEVRVVKSLRDETSLAFKEALVKNENLRSIYLKAVQIGILTNSVSTKDIGISIANHAAGWILVKGGDFDPEEVNDLQIIFSPANNGDRVDFELYANTDFGKNLHLGTVHVDQFTQYTTIGGRYWYSLKADILQLYPVSLSEKISSLSLKIPPSIQNSPLKVVLY